MVGTASWKWFFDDAAHRHVAWLLREFVVCGGAAILDPRALGRPAADGRSSLDPERARDALLGLYSHPLQLPVWEHSRAAAEAVVERIVAELRRIAADHNSGDADIGTIEWRLRTWPVRLHLSGRELALVIGRPRPAVPFDVCVDLSFTRTQVGSDRRFYCILSTSFFSAPPHSPWHAPGVPVHSPADAEELTQWARAVQEIWPRVRARLLPETDGVRALHPVRGRHYETPAFWTIVGDADAARDGARFLLDVPDVDAADVSTGTIVGGLEFWRRRVPIRERFSPAALFDLPTYVLRPPPDNGATPPAEWEERTAAAIVALTSLELQLAVALYDADTDLLMYDNFARVYGIVAEGATVLWDGLVKYLPSQEGSEQAERSIQLIHQVMLQGVADLDQLANGLHTTAARLAGQLEDARSALIANVAEHSSGGLCAALLQEGDAAAVTRRAEEMTERVGRIRADVAALFSSITAAFDERRVRTVDKTAQANFELARFVAVLGAAAVAELVLDFSWELPAGVDHAFQAVTAVVMVGLLLRIRRFGRDRRRRQLGSEAFRAEFDGLRGFLQEVSTVHLEARWAEFGVGGPRTPGDATATAWASLDTRLAARLRDLWTEAYAADHPAVPHSVDDLVEAVERWALRSMLVTERTSMLYHYPLPVLTALYCALSVSGHSDLARPTFASPVRAVSDADLDQMLRHSGFTPAGAEQVIRWLSTPRTGESVADVHARVSSLHLEPKMTSRAIARALDIVAPPA